jgi:DNA (cytosine-5)-methyltransferase 1
MNAVDLFSGCGGLSLGLEKSGVNVVAAFENWEPAVQVYKQNFSHPVFNIDLSVTENAVGLIKPIAPDLIAGGPPCQDFSSAGKRNESLGRADLTISFAKIVMECQPKIFLMENVDLAQKSQAYKNAKNVLSESYAFTERILDASFCGVPQKRKRLFLIGAKNEKDAFLDETIKSKLAKHPLTVRRFLKDSDLPDYYYRHPRSYSRRGIFSIDEPSPTIRGVNRPIPPGYKFHAGDPIKSLDGIRPLTTLERALIQTFPKRFKWGHMNKSTLEQLIGNAVPVNLAKFVGSAIMDYFEQ